MPRADSAESTKQDMQAAHTTNIASQSNSQAESEPPINTRSRAESAGAYYVYQHDRAKVREGSAGPCFCWPIAASPPRILPELTPADIDGTSVHPLSEACEKQRIEIQSSRDTPTAASMTVLEEETTKPRLVVDEGSGMTILDATVAQVTDSITLDIKTGMDLACRGQCLAPPAPSQAQRAEHRCAAVRSVRHSFHPQPGNDSRTQVRTNLKQLKRQLDRDLQTVAGQGQKAASCDDKHKAQFDSSSKAFMGPPVAGSYHARAAPCPA